MAYIILDVKTSETNLCLPEEIIVPKTNLKIILDFFEEETDYEQVYEMIKDAVDDGLYYPQESVDDHIYFKQCFLLHDIFVARDANNKDVIGAFYVKPNFPGRSSHICNAGFFVNKNYRKKGIGEVLYKKYLSIAKKLGYKGSFFNLVYETNEGSIQICRKLGFQEIGIIPKAGKLKGLGYVDALQFYYDLTTLDD